MHDIRYELVKAVPLALRLHWHSGVIRHIDLIWNQEMAPLTNKNLPSFTHNKLKLNEKRKERKETCAVNRMLPHQDVTRATAEGSLLQQALEAYCAGEKALWPELPLDWSRVTSFRKNVYLVLSESVSYGETITYGQLAHRVGSPYGARAVGNAMAHNPWPLLIPCHRVLAAQGLGGFSAADGVSMKMWLLSHEAARM